MSAMPPELDINRPNAARVYDALLGGSHNFAADRQMAQRLLAAEPEAGRWARANRAFLGRAVRFLLGAGIRQFLDIGSGLPTIGSVHEIALTAEPAARVVYVDTDPVVVSISRDLLGSDHRIGIVQADLRSPDAILADPIVRTLIDVRQPIGLLLVAVLHFIPDADGPSAILAWLRDALAPGTMLVISHASVPANMTPAQVAAAREYGTRTAHLALRSRDQVAALFAGWELLPPGVIEVPWWRPEPGDTYSGYVPGWAGAAVKR